MLGSISRLTMRIVVVLPQPEGPISTQTSARLDRQVERVDGGPRDAGKGLA